MYKFIIKTFDQLKMTKEAQRRVTESIEEFLSEIRKKHFNFMEPVCLEECQKYHSTNEDDFKRYLATRIQLGSIIPIYNIVEGP